MKTLTIEDLNKMTVKPWELTYEMAKQQGVIDWYVTDYIGEEDNNGTREIFMHYQMHGEMKRTVFKGILINGIQ